MKIERDAHEIKTEAGTFYVLVQSAERGSHYDFDKKVTVEDITPRVWISTDPEFKGDVEKGHVKIRGRKYSTEYTYKRLPDNQGRLDRHGIVMKWTTDVRTWNGGRRNDKGRQLDYETKAYGVLSEWEVEALNAFETAHPNWQTESVLRLFEYERNRETERAESLRREASAHEIEAQKWQVRIDDLMDNA
ncbi:hypothetical protein ADL35_02280 [Streptomyces sp. NRRL WC-3753]|nr:hypothetical protein ADL35_02280 [Streptomyces sp. NRRL WC-3753]